MEEQHKKMKEHKEKWMNNTKIERKTTKKMNLSLDIKLDQPRLQIPHDESIFKSKEAKEKPCIIDEASNEKDEGAKDRR